MRIQHIGYYLLLALCLFRGQINLPPQLVYMWRIDKRKISGTGVIL